jgi:hypothetical protein
LDDEAGNAISGTPPTTTRAAGSAVPPPKNAAAAPAAPGHGSAYSAAPAMCQGLTLAHYLAQRKRFLWDRGFILGLFGVCL